MTPDNLYELIQEMRRKKAIFGLFAGFVNFNFEHTRTEFKDALIRAYGSFLDALDAAVDDYNAKEDVDGGLILFENPPVAETVIAYGQLAEKEKGPCDPSRLEGCVNGKLHCLKELKEGALYCTVCKKRF